MIRRPLVALLCLPLIAGALSGCSSKKSRPTKAADRVLIVSLPGVRWADVVEHDLPNLESLIGSAAIADLSTRIGNFSVTETDAYLSIGAGTRAVAPPVDSSVAVDPDELYGGAHASDLLQRRLGHPTGGVAYLPVDVAIERNQESLFGAKPGRLGDLLEEAGVQRAVIANADAFEDHFIDEPPPDVAYARGAATALMGTDGIVPAGTVGRGLLEPDPTAAFGRRLNQVAVLNAFDSVWKKKSRSVVLVEASDLIRTSAYESRTSAPQADAMRSRALGVSDTLLGELVFRADPKRDAVLVLSPVTEAESPELAVALLRAPGVQPGLLRSSTTRRDGYVQLVDVAPTVLGLLGLQQPEVIEGRAFEVGRKVKADRLGWVVSASKDAGFRDGLMVKGALTIIAYLIALSLATTLRDRLLQRIRGWLKPVAMGALGVIPASYIVGQIGFVQGNEPAFFGCVLIGAFIAALAGTALERKWKGAGTLGLLGSITLLYAVDLLLGAPLQVNSVFGYSMAVAGRFAGIGNLAFAIFGSAAVVMATLTVERFGKRGLGPAIFLLIAVALLEGLPMLGADVGGAFAMVPAFGVTALLLSGRKLRWKHFAGLGGAAVSAVVLLAYLDAARPEGTRTHLARLAQNVLDGRWGLFLGNLGRRLHASFGSAGLTAWVAIALMVSGSALYSVLVARKMAGPNAAPRRHNPLPSAAAAGLGVLATLGLLANDSSIAVPATMLVVLVPVYVLLQNDQLERSP